MNKLALGIIGVGHLGSIHARLAAGSEAIDLVGVHDLDGDRAAGVAAECGCAYFEDLPELLEQAHAVCVVVPTSEHYAVAVQAMDCGCHLFLEKPMAATVEEARLIVEKARQKNLKVQVGHIERFNPAMLAIRGYKLNPMFVEVHRLSRFSPRGCDVSVVLDLMIHDLDLILYMVNSRVTHVDACGVGVVSDSEDIASVRLKFASGCVANLTSSRISLNPMRRMRLFQKNQYIVLDFLEKKAEIFKLRNADENISSKDISMAVGQIGTGENLRDIIYERPAVPEVNSLQLELEEFARAVTMNLEPKVTGEQGLMALETASSILEQISRPK